MTTSPLALLSVLALCGLGLSACDSGSQADDDATSSSDEGTEDDDTGSATDTDTDSTDASDDTSTDDDESTSDDGTGDATTFEVQISNVTQLLGASVFNTPDGAAAPGPLTTVGASYSVEFDAVPGSLLTFVSMSAATNDHFFSPDELGVALFDADGNPNVGDITDQIELWDAGTEEEDPATVATAPDGGVNGDPDDDDTVRSVQADVSADIAATLAYDAGTFTLTLERLGDAILTPGIAVVHAGQAPLFTVGEAGGAVGLEDIAEAGNPGPNYEWLQEVGESGAPLRLSSSLSPFSPGVIYAFPDSESDPLFTQGEAAKDGSGLEALAEDGDPMGIYDYLSAEGYAVAVSDTPAGPGASQTFTIEASPGDRLGFATMFVQSNDWFFSFNNDGVPFFDESDAPVSGDDFSIQAYLFDAGTEADEDVGFGANQPFRQGDPNTGDVDPDTSVRRVVEINDLQFGKGLIESGPGVVALMDERGGYNLISVSMTAVE